MSTAKVDELAVIINKQLEQYTEEVAEQVKAAAQDAADFCVDKIKSNARSDIGGSGAYAASWKKEKLEESKYNIKYVVHSEAPYYRLAHLLEYGHEIWSHGKNTDKRTKKRPHIRPAERDMEKKFTEDIKARVKKR